MTPPDTEATAPVQTLISEEMRAAIGSVLSSSTSFPVSESDIRRWALAVYYPEKPPARYLHAEAATTTGGIVAPQEFNPFAWIAAAVGEHGERGDGNDPGRIEKGLGLIPPPVRFQVNGGLEVEYVTPMRPGDVVSSASRLAEYRERPGRLGLMLFTTTEDTWTNQNDDVIKRSRMTLIRY